MHQLMRRLALTVTLPLVVGAPVLLVAAPAHAVDMTSTTLTVQGAAAYGEEVRATAVVTNTNTSQPVTSGSVQFSYRPPGFSGESIHIGAAVPVNASGAAVSPVLVTNDGTPFNVTVGSDQYHVVAEFQSAVFVPSSSSTFLTVNKAGSSLAVLPTATTLVADITGQLPGGLQTNSVRPGGGSVTFKVDGQVVGTTNAANGKATISYVLPSGSHTVTASYSGDARYLATTGVSSPTTRTDPIIEARLLSTFPKSKSGWYTAPVQIWFVCRPQGSELVEECPADAALTKSGKGQSISRTVHALDGGSATVTVSGIDIDRDKPVITVKGRTCSATDKVSGVRGGCKMKFGPGGRYTAIATDKAGNRAVKRGVLG